MNVSDVKLHVSDQEFTNALRDLASASRVTIQEVVQQQTKLLIRDIIRFQDPTSGPKGRKNVKRDILRVFRTPKNAESTAKLLIQNRDMAMAYVDNVKSDAMRMRLLGLLQKGTTPTKLGKVLFDMHLTKSRSAGHPDATMPSAAIHNAARYRGIVPKDTSRFVFYTGKRSDLNAYIKMVQDKVGSGEAGWGRAASRLGVSVPQYIRQRATNEGGIAIEEDENKGTYVIRIWNSNQGAVKQNAQRGFVERAINIRYDNMISVTDRILTRRLGAVR